MDPDEVLRNIAAGLDTGDHETAIEGFNSYTQWIAHGGFAGDPTLIAEVDRATTDWADNLDTRLHSNTGGWTS